MEHGTYGCQYDLDRMQLTPLLPLPIASLRHTSFRFSSNCSNVRTLHLRSRNFARHPVLVLYYALMLYSDPTCSTESPQMFRTFAVVFDEHYPPIRPPDGAIQPKAPLSASFT
jgi:hypothetical protein